MVGQAFKPSRGRLISEFKDSQGYTGETLSGKAKMNKMKATERRTWYSENKQKESQ